MQSGGGGQAPFLNASQISKDQTKANVNSAVSSARLNNVNQVTPFGNLSWAETGGQYDFDGNWIPQFTATQTLSPQAQGLANKDMELYGLGQDLTARGTVFSNRAMSYAEPLLERIGGSAQVPLKDQSQFRDDAYKALMSRGSAELDRQEEAARTRLANQGVAIGSEASNRDLDTYGRARNDLTNTALINATNLAGQNLDQDIRIRNQPFQELGALMSFANIPGLPGGTPSPSYVPTQYSPVQSPDTTSPQLMAFNAANQNYMQNQANATSTNNAIIGGLFGLAGAGLGAAARRPGMFGLG